MKKRLKPSVIDNIFTDKESVSTRFHNSSSIKELEYTPLPVKDWKESWIKINYKEYPRFQKIPLSPTSRFPNISLKKILENRVSRREFPKNSLSYSALSTILNLSAGLNPKNTTSTQKRRYYPTAGARFSTEIYPVVQQAQIPTLKGSSYHFNVKRNCLEEMFHIENFETLVYDIVGQDWVLGASTLLCISAVFDRLKVKYGERGYRYALIEAGHVAQNIYLVCEALGISCCAIGGFHDVKINEHLGLDGRGEAVIYMLAIGE